LGHFWVIKGLPPEIEKPPEEYRNPSEASIYLCLLGMFIHGSLKKIKAVLLSD
jgi:hypothetical protein